MAKNQLKIRTPYNSSSFKKTYEENNNPSMTVPDQAMSVSELLRRYASGKPLMGRTDATYNEDEYYPDLKKLDLTELHELKEANARRIKEIQEQMTQAQIEIARTKQYEQFRKQYEKEQQELQEQKQKPGNEEPK